MDVGLPGAEGRYQGEVTHLAWLGVTKQSRHFGCFRKSSFYYSFVFYCRGGKRKLKRMVNMSERLTKDDIKKIEAEIEERKVVLRPKLIEAVKEAGAQGDLSENFEYYAAKREKNQNEGRIKYLERMIRFCHVYEDSTEDDQVGIGKEVELYFEEDGETEKFKIVTSIRGNSLQGRLSIESPIGKAVIGKKAGDRVLVSVGNGGYYVKIVSIRPDNGDDDIRSF